MKAGFIILISLLASLFACQQQETQDQHIAMLVDITQQDDHQIPTGDQLKQLFGYTDQTLWHGSSFLVSTISEAKYSEAQQLNLSEENPYLSNEGQRIAAVRTYLKESGELAQQAKLYRSERQYSHVLGGIAGALTDLSSKEGKYRLLVFSDLQHHSPTVSFYDENTEVQQAIQKVFSEMDLLGITIDFIYKPPNYQKLTAFEAVATEFKNVLQKQGAIVTIKTNNHE